jgi:hypothetical protein
VQKTDVARTIPDGITGIWFDNKSQIPQEWHECDGASGRADLRGSFLRGTATGECERYDLSESHNHSYTTIPSHSHTAGTGGNHFHLIYVDYDDAGAYNSPIVNLGPIVHSDLPFSTCAAHSHSVSVTGASVCTTNNTSHLPPYITVIYMVYDHQEQVPPTDDTGLIVTVIVVVSVIGIVSIVGIYKRKNKKKNRQIPKDGAQ